MQSNQSYDLYADWGAFADDWTILLLDYHCTHLPQSKLQCYVLTLTKQLTAAIAEEPIDRAAIRDVGAALARLCKSKEEALGETQELMARYLLNASEIQSFAVLSYLVPLLTELAVGFIRQARVEQMLPHEMFFAEQSSYKIVEHFDIYLNALLSNLPIVLFTTDRDGIITFSDGQALQRLGIPSEKLVGHPVTDICQAFFPQDAEHILHHVYRALNGESLQSIGKAGHIVFDVQYDPLRDANGSLTGVIGVALDVTKQAQAQSELAPHARSLA